MAKVRPNRINKTTEEKQAFIASFAALAAISQGIKKVHGSNSKTSQRASK
ncbi:hypothetical protein [Pseudocolwellia agarivorans]|nr:hypothetical protein [Pseudocolwellia agarivorans]